ncbi:hypothetical protein [Sphingobacterium sp. BN32]|uniref:hypothetical protein n=1 Tax=Sphingobacterium sp. BN32 TaxID=3058432 RepID=UPI00265D46B1|nr:hypothetical protein [Sphingobacterium sp. BN32]WKK58540.1 hypothetical protein QYC40_18115 [Sphingobacterium sp. BN32]
MVLNKEEINQELERFFVAVPRLDLRYIEKISSATGIYQHALYNIPDYRHGYCLDDNCRAMLLFVLANEFGYPTLDHPLFRSYLSFVAYAQREDGRFRNFMSYDLRFLEDVGSDDSVGRCIWSLGVLLANDRFSAYHPLAFDLFNRSIPHFSGVRSVRAVAYLILGLVDALTFKPKDGQYLTKLQELSAFLVGEYRACATASWHWFEEIISYDNAVLPLSLIRAARILNNKDWEAIGIESFHFLDKILFRENHLSIIGNEGWYRKGEKPNAFGQQPIEVPSIMLLYQELYRLDGKEIWLNKANMAFLWYLGKNDMRQSLYNPVEGSCYDGLESYGVNQNQGAESNLAFWMGYLLVRI